MEQYYWPYELPRSSSLETYIALFRWAGYEIGDSDPSFEKLAIFAQNGVFRHVARQLPSGQWTSKMGANVDIEHDLVAVQGGRYGDLHSIMQRERRV